MIEPELDVIGNLVERIKSLEERIGILESLEFMTVTIKTDTGDPATGYTGQVVVNTFDNTVKGWADSGWRTFASGW